MESSGKRRWSCFCPEHGGVMRRKTIIFILAAALLSVLLLSCGGKGGSAKLTELSVEELTDFVKTHGNYGSETPKAEDGKVGSEESGCWASYETKKGKIISVTLHGNEAKLGAQKLAAYFMESVNLLKAGPDAEMGDMQLLMEDLLKRTVEGSYLVDQHHYLLNCNEDEKTLTIDLMEDSKGSH